MIKLKSLWHWAVGLYPHRAMRIRFHAPNRDMAVPEPPSAVKPDPARRLEATIFGRVVAFAQNAVCGVVAGSEAARGEHDFPTSASTISRNPSLALARETAAVVADKPLRLPLDHPLAAVSALRKRCLFTASALAKTVHLPGDVTHPSGPQYAPKLGA